MKKWRALNGWVFGNMQNPMNTFSEARYYLHKKSRPFSTNCCSIRVRNVIAQYELRVTIAVHTQQSHADADMIWSLLK